MKILKRSKFVTLEGFQHFNIIRYEKTEVK